MMGSIFDRLKKAGLRTAGLSVYVGVKRAISEYLGSVITKKNWKKIPSKNIVTVDPITLSEVIKISQKSFKTTPNPLYFRYSKIFNHISYVAKKGSTVVGYCIYYIKPSISLKGIKKDAVIYSLAVDTEFRNQGIAKELLFLSISEMKLNNISEIIIYVNKKNIPAYYLYIKFGFRIIGEVENIKADGVKFYKMSLN
jgi:[ribosomal protein S18]-alanine N-acetyltransferase